MELKTESVKDPEMDSVKEPETEPVKGPETEPVPEPEEESKKEPEREWTVMFYFASDNPLAPGIVSQLKSIKNAGYHYNVNIVAQFDPHTKGTPTHIFDVNRVNKLKHPGGQNIGFSEGDPYIRNLVLDKLWADECNDDETPKRIKKILTDTLKRIHDIDYFAPKPPPYLIDDDDKGNDTDNKDKGKGKDADDQNEDSNDAKTHSIEIKDSNNNPKYDDGKPGEPKDKRKTKSELSPKESLESFLGFCADFYPARHYALFIVGHGVVVGNDIFLYDADAPKDSLSLSNLKELLNGFKGKIAKEHRLELLGLHSCSMSSLEVAYELQGTAKYMLASQGPEFVGSWPYREILIRILKDQSAKINDTINRIFDYVLYNSYDFQLAGYSFDLCLSRLDRPLTPLTDALKDLSQALIDGVAEEGLARQLIILAHWDAQSFWQESYIDLYDFCFCLAKRCKDTIEITSASTQLESLVLKCEEVNKNLNKQIRTQPKNHPFESAAARIESPDATAEGSDARIEGSDATTESPEATTEKPIVKLIERAEFAGPESQYSHGFSVYFPWSEPLDHRFWPRAYEGYTNFNETRWGAFLQAYFDKTMRDAIGEPVLKVQDSTALAEVLLEEITKKIFNVDGQLSSGALGDGKPGSTSGVGDDDGKPGSGSGVGDDDGKPGGSSGAGIGCGCPSIKNYPSFTKKKLKDKKDRNPAASAGFPTITNLTE